MIELRTSDEELSHSYQVFLLRAIQEANKLGLARKHITKLLWRDDSQTGDKVLMFVTELIGNGISND